MTPGLLVISHGSRDAGWVALVEETVEAVRGRLGKELRVEAAYLELVEGRLIQDGLDRMVEAGVTDLLALPLFVSGGSTHVAEIGWALGAYLEPGTDTDLEPFRASPMRVDYGRPMGATRRFWTSSAIGSPSCPPTPSRESLLLIGHGSEEAGFARLGSGSSAGSRNGRGSGAAIAPRRLRCCCRIKRRSGWASCGSRSPNAMRWFWGYF